MLKKEKIVYRNKAAFSYEKTPRIRLNEKHRVRARTVHHGEETALVYVFREAEYVSLRGIRIEMNHTKLATLYPKRVYLCALNPGLYVFTAYAANTDHIIFNVEKGKTYYIEVISQMGFTRYRCKLVLTDPILGAQKVQRFRLAGINKEAHELLQGMGN